MILTHRNTESVVLVNIEKFQKSISIFTYSKLNSRMKMTHVILVYIRKAGCCKEKKTTTTTDFNERTEDRRCAKDGCKTEKGVMQVTKKRQRTAAVRMNLTRSQRKIAHFMLVERLKNPYNKQQSNARKEINHLHFRTW